jgi:osmotically-inducible protein OsmY
MNCSSSGCCAHPTGSFSDGFVLPGKEVGDVTGAIKWDLVRIKGLDASQIAVDSEPKGKTVTIHGTVKSAVERELVQVTTKRHAGHYKIVNQLEIKK